MKKLLIGVVAVFCCLALAGPAMAKVTMGGMIQTDVFYWSQSDEYATGGVQENTGGTNDNGNDTLQINMPRAQNRLNLHYESDDKLLLGVIEYRAGALTPGATTEDTFEMYYAWLDWRPYGETFHIRVGRQPETFAVMAPGAAGMGHTEFTLLVGYGNLHASNGDMVKFYAKASDMVRFELAFQDPNGGTSLAGALAQEFPAGSVPDAVPVRDETKMPRIDLAVPIKIGNFTIEPSATYLKKSYDQVLGGVDDDVDIWGVAVGARAGFGPVTLMAEGTIGQNFVNGNYTGGGHAPGFLFPALASVEDNNGDGIAETIEDTEYLGGWFQISFDFGPAAIEAAIGYEKIENDGASGAADDFEQTRMGYALRVPIKVTKNFTIAPNFIYQDRDDDLEIGAASFDMGSQWLLGAAFNLVF